MTIPGVFPFVIPGWGKPPSLRVTTPSRAFPSQTLLTRRVPCQFTFLDQLFDGIFKLNIVFYLMPETIMVFTPQGSISFSTSIKWFV